MLFFFFYIFLPHSSFYFVKNSSADRWKHERKLFNHTFGVSVLQSYVPIFNKCISQSFTQLDEQVDKGEFDIHDYVTEVMMTAILSRFSFLYNIFRLYNIIAYVWFSPVHTNRYNIWEGNQTGNRKRVCVKNRKVTKKNKHFLFWNY